MSSSVSSLRPRRCRSTPPRAPRVLPGPSAPAFFLALTYVAIAPAACDAPAPAPAFCSLPLTSALINGNDVPSSPIPAAAQAAIGALRKPSGELVCTGTLIADRWILTARHCVDASTFDGLVFHTARDLTELTATVAEYYPHPALDVMLLRIPPGAPLSALALQPIPLWDPSEPADWSGATLTLAGLGNEADGSDGRLQFLDEPVVEVDADTIVVDGGSEHGACAGDSGGPLLTPSSAEATRLVGVLSAGNATCRGRDRYVASAAFARWITETQDAAGRDPCAGVPAEGTCENGGARWCTDGAVQAEACTDDRLCGWNADAGGYRCVPSDADPCRGAGPGGSCDGNTLRVCQRGTLVETDCGACALTCQQGPNGHAGCV
jgi:hypothetical protein